jgi:carbon starvation protein
MTILLIALGSIALFVLAYLVYGRWLSKRIFELDPNAVVPSIELRDDLDFVPTHKSVVFGHHFTSIAGTGPIVGPAIAIMWGWVPALLWIVLGSILIGAVHDLGSLVISLRNRGQSIGDIAGRLISPRVRLLFLLILLFALWVVLAVFGLVIATVFRQFPASITPVFLQIPIAVAIGWWLYRRGGSMLIPSLLALAAMYLTVWLGSGSGGGALGAWMIRFNTALSEWPVATWTAILMVYCYLASVLPVWILLQPRDYINSLQLISCMGLIVAGLVVAGFAGVGGQPLEMVAPAFDPAPLNAPPMMPILFITLACGAISGFHCLVSSGTSSKQLRKETDATFVGYGSMLTEAFLAVIVILAVGAGIGFGWPGHSQATGVALWNEIYGDWTRADAGLGVKIGAFVAGATHFLSAIGIETQFAMALIGVLVASFAGTTMDTATRLQRYVIEELAKAVSETMPAARPLAQPFRNMHVATMLAVVSAFILAALPLGAGPWSWSTAGSGGLVLWPIFGAINQLLGGLAFLVICFWLWRRRKPVWFAAIPGVFMLVMPAWAMLLEYGKWWSDGKIVLVFLATVALVLEAWMVIEGVLIWPRARGVLEEALPKRPSEQPVPASALE